MAERRKHIEQGDTPDKPASKKSAPSSSSCPSIAAKKSLDFAVSENLYLSMCCDMKPILTSSGNVTFR